MSSVSSSQTLSAAAAAATTAVTGAGTAQVKAGTASHNGRPTITDELFGHVDGAPVFRYTLANAAGLTVRILTYGGIVQSVHLPDGRGHSVDIVLGFPTLADYVAHNSPHAGGGVYFGALVGRYANRIAKGTFTLDGVEYHVPLNNNGNALHGGTDGFDKKLWTPSVETGADSVSLRLRYVSPDGEMGFPGTLTTDATYTLDNAGSLTLAFYATTDKPTVVNLTNHTYWNLAGESAGNVYGHQLYLNANHYTPVDSTQIPTGAVLPVAGTPLDFTQPTAIGARIAQDDPQLLIGQGYDQNWALNGQGDGHGGELALAARAVDEHSGRSMTVWTTQPAIQFYSGNFLTGALVGTGDTAYRQSYGFALETQHYPDSPNHANFPSTVLRPGEEYEQTTVFQFSAD